MSNPEALKVGKKLLRRRRTNWFILLLGIILVIIGSVQIPDTRQQLVANQPGLYKVLEVYDGDTVAISMNGVREKIRMIGVDTPETHDPRKEVQCFGKAASEFTRELLDGQNVRLEADPTNQNRDRYDRLLRYIYLPDGTLVNAKLIEDGYGFAYIHFPFEKLDEFEQLENEAREAERGLWGSCEAEIGDDGSKSTNDEASEN